MKLTLFDRIVLASLCRIVLGHESFVTISKTRRPYFIGWDVGFPKLYACSKLHRYNLINIHGIYNDVSLVVVRERQIGSAYNTSGATMAITVDGFAVSGVLDELV
jgi:hypothetical protein